MHVLVDHDGCGSYWGFASVLRLDVFLSWLVGAGWLDMFFFFQAEDGIRDVAVTGVQTCALPICAGRRRQRRDLPGLPPRRMEGAACCNGSLRRESRASSGGPGPTHGSGTSGERSEERRVGEECRSRGSPYH